MVFHGRFLYMYLWYPSFFQSRFSHYKQWYEDIRYWLYVQCISHHWKVRLHWVWTIVHYGCINNWSTFYSAYFSGKCADLCMSVRGRYYIEVLSYDNHFCMRFQLWTRIRVFIFVFSGVHITYPCINITISHWVVYKVWYERICIIRIGQFPFKG